MIQIILLLFIALMLYVITLVWLDNIDRKNWPGWVKTVAKTFTWMGSILMLFIAMVVMAIIDGSGKKSK